MSFKSLIKKYKNLLLIIITIILNCIIYWNYLKGHFSTESYGVALGYKSYGINVHLVDGRLFSCLLFLLAELIDIPIKIFMSISVFIGIVIGTFAVYKLKSAIVKLVKVNDIQEIIIYIISYSVIFNFMLVEILYFPETCIMVSSILLYIISASLFIEKKYIMSAIFLLIGVFCYQGTIGFFVVCAFLFSMIKNRGNIKEIILDILKMALIGVIVSAINLIFINLISKGLNLQQHKQFSMNLSVIYKNILSIIINSFPILQKTLGLFPKNLLFMFITIILIYTLLIMKHEKNDRIAAVGIVIIVTIASSFILFIIQRTSMYTGRVHFCIGSIIGIALMYIYTSSNIRNEKKLEKIFLTILITYCIINCANAMQIVTEHQKINQLEKEECIRIEKIIQEYEKENKIEVTKIAPIAIVNQTEKGYFSQIKRRAIVTYNNVRHYYGYSGIIQYYLRNDLKNLDLNSESHKIYKEYVEKENINYGDIICIGDTLYCPQYIF